jgi:glycerophosphoryl diester phosphodiesterase
MLFSYARSRRLPAARWLLTAILAACDASAAPDAALDAPADAPRADAALVDAPLPPCAPADNAILCGAPLLIAHRGGGRLRPEATLLAFENAASLGADVLELDVHSTSDGEIVCLHDDTVDRTTDGTGPVHGMTLAEVRALDAGYAFSTDGGASHPYRGMGVTIPTLQEVLEAFPDAWFSIEIKQSEPDIVLPVIAVIDAADAADHVVLVSFSDAVVSAIRARRPELVTGMSSGEMAQLLVLRPSAEASYVPPTTIVQIPAGSVTHALMARAHRFGLRLHAWTVNDRDEMERLLDLGVHGVMTDDPALLAEVLAER